MARRRELKVAVDSSENGWHAPLSFHGFFTSLNNWRSLNNPPSRKVSPLLMEASYAECVL